MNSQTANCKKSIMKIPLGCYMIINNMALLKLNSGEYKSAIPFSSFSYSFFNTF